MKYRLADGCSAVSHAGKPIAIASDGTIDLDDSSAADLLPHGIVRAGEEKTEARAVDGKAAASPDKRMLR